MMFQLPVFYLTAPQLPILHVIAIQMPALHPVNLHAGPSSDDHATTDMPADETAASLSIVGCVASTPATTVIRDLIRNISPLPNIISTQQVEKTGISRLCMVIAV